MTLKHFYTTALMLATFLFSKAQDLPVWEDKKQIPVTQDWLVKPINIKAQILKSADGKDIILFNGLLKRVFRTSPNLACIDFSNLKTGKQLLRAVHEEARVTIDGKKYNIGGLKGQKQKAYLLNESVDEMKIGPNDFRYVSFEIKPITQQLKWKNDFWSLERKSGTGKMISFLFVPGNKSLNNIEIKVNYEIYDGMPLLVKSINVANKGKSVFKIDSVVNEVLGMVEEESAVEGSWESMKKPQGIYFETNYAYNNSMRYVQSDQTTHWKPDTSYTSQVHYRFQTPVLMENYPEHAPGIILQPGEAYNSVRTHEMLMDSYDREARGLAVRKMYGAVAPWTLANPIYMHAVSRSDEQAKQAIDQCVATGFEALIISWYSDLHMEDTSQTNYKKWKAIADYAHSKNIKIGCYSLFSSRSISLEDDIVDPKTGKVGGAFFGKAPCLGSRWGLWYQKMIKDFFVNTGFDIFEHDGPYPGDVCGSTSHPGHKNAEDSQWRQMEMQKEMYHWLRERGVLIDAPDWYVLDGTNRVALGYREVNFSLPRAQQRILNRQNIYDATWEKTGSMSWGFVPITEYHGGGEAATLEPLSKHLVEYEQAMMEYFGAGIQAIYRGLRLYDTDETKAVVVKVVSWYKKYRNILNSEVIHLRRADGNDWDGILHVNPSLKEKGLAMLYNPTKQSMTKTIKLPLYYTGLTEIAKIREKEGAARSYKLNRDYTVDITIMLKPESYSWFVIE